MVRTAFAFLRSVGLTGAVVAITTLASAQFTPGRLAILEMPFTPLGGGGYSIPTTGGQLAIREFATDGTPGITVLIPNTGPEMLVSPFQSLGASLTRSPAGDKLVFTGFTGASDGSFNLVTSSASSIPRGIGTVDAAGNYQRPFTTTVFFSGSTMRAATTDGISYWAGGGNSGVCYLGPGSPAVINAEVTGTEDLQFLPTGLFRSSGALQKVGAGPPLVPSTQQTLFSSSLLLGFQMNQAGDVCYTANSSLIRKWVLSGSTWTNVYSFSSGTFLVRIVVDFSGPNPIIYGIKNTPSSLIKWVDTGAPSAGTVLATHNGGAWYGINFTPIACVEGATCDDGHPNTINDIVRADCQCLGNSLALSAKVFLEGPFDSGIALMNDALRTLPDFPFVQPFTPLGLAPTGGATTITPGVLNTTGNNAIVDWILIELRDAATGANVLLRTPALVQRDGDVVGLDGTGPLQLPALPGNYRVAVRHRNHFGAMINAILPLSSTPTVVDFTSTSTVTWGTEACKNVHDFMVLWSGEVLRNGQLAYTGANNDRDPILLTVGSTTPNNIIIGGYRSEDVNMNGSTSYTGGGNDRDPILINVGSTTPNTVRMEQLP